jgi:hypothetical protein
VILIIFFMSHPGACGPFEALEGSAAIAAPPSTREWGWGPTSTREKEE